MKYQNVAETIRAILADKSAYPSTVRRWEAALAVEIDGKRGAPEAREIQKSIRDRWATAKNAVTIKKIPIWMQVDCSHSARLERRKNAERDAQRRHERLMADAERGYPKLCLRGTVDEFGASLTALTDLIGGGIAQYARVGNWIISSSESISYDNHAYSKSWHRAHGGKKTVDSRTVIIRRWTPDGIENRDVQVSSWAGNWALKALVESGVVSPVKVPAKLKSVQLNSALDIRLVRSIFGVSIYERTIAGSHYDYCALAGTITFHGASIRKCLKGLHKKITEITVAKNSPINWDLCRSLGFCETGIQEFCSDFGLDIKGNYSPEKIHEIVKTDIGTAAKYETELRKMARVLNYSI